jgi:microcystin-dependent protein
LLVTGGVGIGENLNVDGSLSVLDDTDASSSTSAPLKSAGGLAIAKKTYIGDNIIVPSGKGLDFSADSRGIFKGLPPGLIEAYGGTTAPDGWLECAGVAVSRTTYAALFAAIGTSWGEGDGSTTFHLPDLVGRFLRGRDTAGTRDADYASRTACNTGGEDDGEVGSVHTDAFQGHYHNQQRVYPSGGSNNYSGTFVGATADMAWATGAAIDGTHGTIKVSTETRPINASVMFIIKT